MSDEEKEVYLTLCGFKSYQVEIYDEMWTRWDISIDGFDGRRLSTSAAYEIVSKEFNND